MTRMSLIITIVRKGWGDRALEASMKAGASGGTILLGRGGGVHETQKILGIPIEPEREVVLTGIFPDDRSEAILREISEACELNKPGSGLAFVIPAERAIGVCHYAAECDQGEPGVDVV